MHDATDSEFYLRKGFRVVGIEANAELCRAAQVRLPAEVASGRLTIVNAAIAGGDGEVTFYLNEQETEWGTTDPAYAAIYQRLGAPSRSVRVEATRFARLLQDYGIPYYLKVDIEGADLLCFEDLAEFEARPRYVSIESPRTSFERLFDQLALLWRLGYRRFKIIPQHLVARQTCPQPAREGLYVDHRFGLGSSGLFGAELPGEWLGIERTLARYRWLLRVNRRLGLSSPLRQRLPRGRGLMDRFSGWYDTHAMHGGAER